MTREQSIKWAAEIAALQQGKVIEQQYVIWSEGLWQRTDNPNFDLENWSFRIRPEPIVRPFREGEACPGWIVRKKHNQGHRGVITSVDGIGFRALGEWYSFPAALDKLELLSPDGTWGPCGVKEDGK